MSAGELTGNRAGANLPDNIIREFVFGHSFKVGDLVYNDGDWRKAIANSDAELNDSFATNVVVRIIGSLVYFAPSGSLVRILLPFSGSIGVFLSQDIAGGYTDVRPSTGFVQQVGWYTDGKLNFHYSSSAQGGGTVATAVGDDYIINVDTVLYTHKVRRDGSKLQVELLIKDAYSNFVLDNFIPSGLSDFMRFDYFSQVVTDDGGVQESIIFRISQELSKLTTNSPEKFYFQTIMGGNSNEAYVGDANLGVTKINSSRWLAYDTPGTIYPPIRDEAVSFTCNVDNYAAPETPRPIQLKILLYADLL